MPNETLTWLSRLPELILGAAVSILTAYFLLRGKRIEAESQKEVTKISNEDDIILAYGSLQSQLALAAQNMVGPLNTQIENLQRRVSSVENENVLLRSEGEAKSKELKSISSRVNALEKENAVLRGKLENAQQAENRLRRRLEQIRTSIKDTGELSSGVHIIGDDDK